MINSKKNLGFFFSIAFMNKDKKCFRSPAKTLLKTDLKGQH